jgi:hypothetical protein
MILGGFSVLFSNPQYSPALIWAFIGASSAIFTTPAATERKSGHILLRFQSESG